MLYYFCTVLVPKPLSTSIAVQGLQLHLEFILSKWDWDTMELVVQWKWYTYRQKLAFCIPATWEWDTTAKQDWYVIHVTVTLASTGRDRLGPIFMV